MCIYTSQDAYPAGMALPDKRDRINPDALGHVWAQVAADIRQDIDSGQLSYGAKLPSEYELAEQYGVARGTIRRALKELVGQDYLVVVFGRGTFVARR